MAGQTVAISVLADTAPFAKAMKGIGIGVGAALGAVAAGVVALGAEAFKAVAEVERLNAQTSAAIASTGSAANRTIEQITGVADSLERMSGVEAEVIQAGQNMLLTFTNIKGDNFDAATKAALDMSVAMGTDMTSASTLVGKALNDPIKGIGALSKVGVQLTEDQKALVQSMVDTGDAAGAQGVILGVLNEQFGGSAEAFGGTFLGTVEKVKNSFGTLTEAFVVGMLPAATAVLSSLNDLMVGLADSPAFAAVVESVNGFVGSLFSGEGAIGSFAGQAIALITSVSPLSILLQAITPLLPQLADMFTMLASTIGGTLITLLPTLTELAGTLASTLTGVLAAALPPIAQLISQLAGVLSFLIPALAPVITMLGETLATSLTTLAPLMATVAATVGGVLGTALSALGPVIVLVATTFGELMTALMPLVAAILPLVSAVLMLIDPIAALISAILPPVIGLFVALLKPVLSLIAPLVELLTPAIELVAGVLTAIVGIIAGVIGWFVQLVTGGEKTSRGFTNAFSGVAGFFGDMIGSIVGFFKDLPSRILGIFAGAGRWLYDIGRNIIEGLIGGAGSLLRNLGSFFLDLVPSFIREPFKQALGIRSPSRVFRGFGINVVEGLAIGLEQLAPVRAAVGALSAAVVDGYTPPGAVAAQRVASDARAVSLASRSATPSGAASNVTELGAATIQALAQVLGLTVNLDGSTIAANSSAHYARSTWLGAA